MRSERLHVGARVRGPAADFRRRLFLFVELQFAMALGALACLLVGRVARAWPIYATEYRPGTVPYFLGDVFFLTLPVVIWMLIRGFGRRRSLELALAMLSPVAAIVLLGQLTGAAYLLWLVTAMYPAMSVGMLAYLVFRPGDRGLYCASRNYNGIRWPLRSRKTPPAS